MACIGIDHGTGHATDASRCRVWPAESYTPCGIDWQGRHWHNIGWYPQDRTEAIRAHADELQADLRFHERSHPGWGIDWREAFLSDKEEV